MTDRGAMVLNRMATRHRRGTGRIGRICLVSLAILCGGWSILWLVARGETNRRFDALLVAERLRGRVWACQNRSVRGYPLDVVLRCENPSFAEAKPEGTLRGRLAGLEAEAALYFPTNVLVTLRSPLEVEDGGVALAATATWADLHINLRGAVPGDLDRGQLDATDLVIVPRPGAAPTRIDRLSVGLRPIRRGGDDRLDLEATLKAANVDNPDANALLASAEPIAVSAAVAVNRIGPQGANIPEVLEGWRRAGGDLRITSFEIGKGAFRMAGQGRLDLDDEHRIQGKLDSRFSGLEPVAARFGVPLGAVKIGGALASLLGGKKGSTTAPTDLALPLAFRDGRLAVGPFKTGVGLDPLY